MKAADLERFTRLALGCITREFPYALIQLLDDEGDIRLPRDLTPAFYGCFDWHSAVHGHWLLARFLRFSPDSELAPAAREGLTRHLTEERLEREAAHLRSRPTFERPYGLAWLLQLAAELREWSDSGDGEDRASAGRWASALEPAALVATNTFAHWLPRLTYPERSGQHGQSAFSLGLVLDWARLVANPLEDLLVARCRELYLDDHDAPLHFEPSGHDFLSPALGEADLMRRVLTPQELAQWLEQFLPSLPRDGDGSWLPVARVSDRADGKLAHLDGLNLSRAWMLEGIAQELPEGDDRRLALLAAATTHRDTGLAAVTGEHYAGSHWLGTFAMYLVTGRGLG